MIAHTSLGNIGLVCPEGQAPTNMYDGTVKCCGVPGTPDSQNPCSYMNTNTGYQATQIAAEQAQLQTWNQFPNSVTDQILRAAQGVPNNIAQDADTCFYNPGKTFVDSAGIRITCPSDSVTSTATAGQPESTMTQVQLMALLNAQYGDASRALNLASNVPLTTVVPTTPVLSTAPVTVQQQQQQQVSRIPTNPTPVTSITDSGVTNLVSIPGSNAGNSNGGGIIPTVTNGISSFLDSIFPSIGLNPSPASGGTTNTNAGSSPTVSTDGSMFSGITPTEMLLGGAALIGLLFFMSKK